jgi:transposase-like protein
MSFGEEKDLTFKPFHNINFPDRYKNTKEPEKKTMKQRKTRVFITDEIYKSVILPAYKAGTPYQDIAKQLDVSRATVSNWYAKARKEVAERKEEKREEKTHLARIRELENEVEYYKGFSKGLETRLEDETKIREAAILVRDTKINKLEAKVEVLTELLKDRG